MFADAIGFFIFFVFLLLQNAQHRRELQRVQGSLTEQHQLELAMERERATKDDHISQQRLSSENDKLSQKLQESEAKV